MQTTELKFTTKKWLIPQGDFKVTLTNDGPFYSAVLISISDRTIESKVGPYSSDEECLKELIRSIRGWGKGNLVKQLKSAIMVYFAMTRT
jgi:hypothetical protein